MILALDCETTGLDLFHEARPYFVTSCDDEGNQLHWEWPVDPKTRIPLIPEGAVDEIRDLIERADRIVFQNGKFDITALASIGIDDFPWEKVEDTLIAGHLLYTSQKHTLDAMVLQYLGDDISHHEDALEKACQEARRLVRTKRFREEYGVWRIADKDEEGMPSVKGKMWKQDMWLLLAIAQECEYPPDHPYWNLVERYANADSYWTLALWGEMERLLHERDLYDEYRDGIYRERMKVIPVAYEMERRGVTLSGDRTYKLMEEFTERRTVHIGDLERIAEREGYRLKMPKSGNNDSLTDFVFKHLKLPVIKRNKPSKKEPRGSPTLDKGVIEELSLTLPAGSIGLEFIMALQQKRRLDTGLQYMEGYQRYWLPAGAWNPYEEQLWYLLHPSLNPTGTVQLRWSSSNPNAQNISKQKGYNLRYIFGPAEGREWWSLDAQNIELRIPAFESGEIDLINVFLRPKDPPYYGSYHLVVFDLLHPEKFKQYGKDCKDEFESTEYQWVKNGNFSFIYGAQKKKCDATFKVKDAFEKVRYRFPKIAELSDRQLNLARERGYVETIPDKTVNPRRGFPIMASRTDDGYVMPTTPLNYHVSGTAMWWTQQAMVKCHDQLREWKKRKFDAFITMQVHDEMVFDLPKSRVSPAIDLEKEKKLGQYLPLSEYKSNLGKVRVLQRLMESCGENISVPTPVGVEYNAENWADISLKC